VECALAGLDRSILVASNGTRAAAATNVSVLGKLVISVCTGGHCKSSFEVKVVVAWDYALPCCSGLTLVPYLS